MPPRKYIYGIIEETQPQRFTFSGVGEAEVYTINYQKLAAVVSDTELQHLDPTRKNVHAHTVVQDKILGHYTLLPMGFGMIADSEADVLLWLQKNYQGLVSELNRLAGKIEVELKVFWDEESMMRQLQGENQKLSTLKAKINAASSPLEARNVLLEVGEQVEHVALDWKTRYAERVYAILNQLAIDAQLNNPTGVNNLLNASFLIDKAKESHFREQVYKLDSQCQGNVNFKYVGPLAPYNFVNLELEH